MSSFAVWLKRWKKNSFFFYLHINNSVLLLKEVQILFFREKIHLSWIDENFVLTFYQNHHNNDYYVDLVNIVNTETDKWLIHFLYNHHNLIMLANACDDRWAGGWVVNWKDGKSYLLSSLSNVKSMGMWLWINYFLMFIGRPFNLIIRA